MHRDLAHERERARGHQPHPQPGERPRPDPDGDPGEVGGRPPQRPAPARSRAPASPRAASTPPTRRSPPPSPRRAARRSRAGWRCRRRAAPGEPNGGWPRGRPVVDGRSTGRGFETLAPLAPQPPGVALRRGLGGGGGIQGGRAASDLSICTHADRARSGEHLEHDSSTSHSVCGVHHGALHPDRLLRDRLHDARGLRQGTPWHRRRGPLSPRVCPADPVLHGADAGAAAVPANSTSTSPCRCSCATSPGSRRSSPSGPAIGPPPHWCTSGG